MNTLKPIKILDISENKTPKFVKTQLIKAQRGDDKPFFWEMTKGYDSVHVLIINRDKEEVILVEQARVPVMVASKGKICYITEACAGLVDKEASIPQIVKEEILEECGYDVPLENIKHLKTLRSSVGTVGSKAYAYIAEVNEQMKVNEGGGLPEEDIAVIRIKFEDVYSWLYEKESNTDAITALLLTYFMFMDSKL